MRTITRSLALTLVLALAACGARSTMADRDPDAATVLEVQNQSNLDMTIYALREGGERVRLGSVTAHLTEELVIPPRLLFGVTALRFQADPVGADRSPVTQTITVEPGDTVVLIIPPF